jgi:hypothetical protein
MRVFLIIFLKSKEEFENKYDVILHLLCFPSNKFWFINLTLFLSLSIIFVIFIL